jgi:transposase-like protein
MPRKISAKERVSAVKDYVTSGESLRVVSERHGMSVETLRRFAEGKIRKKGRRPNTNGVLTLPFAKERKERDPNKATPNANRRWSRSEDELLRDAVYSKFTVKETTDLLGRSKQSVYCRKSQLMDEGFIQDTRFNMPTGIKRTRRSLPVAPVRAETPVIVDTVITKPIPGNAPKNEVNLRELAALVRDFGVSVTMNVTTEGTNILMHN